MEKGRRVRLQFKGNSSLQISQSKGKLSKMFKGMEAALNEGNKLLANSKSEDLTDAINNCFNTCINLTTDYTVDSKPLEPPSKMNTTMLNSDNFDRELGNSYSNVEKPQLGDIIRYGGKKASHGAVFLLDNGNGGQFFTKNGFSNIFPYKLSDGDELIGYGSPSGRKNYIKRQEVSSNENGKFVTRTKEVNTSDKYAYYRKK